MVTETSLLMEVANDKWLMINPSETMRTNRVAKSGDGEGEVGRYINGGKKLL